MMAYLKRAALVVLGLVIISHAAEAKPAGAPDSAITEEFLNGHRIVNIVDDVLDFWRQAKGRSLRRGRRLWMKMVENRHRDYFERAVYPTLDPLERRAMLDDFLLELPERVESIRRFNEKAEERVIDGVVAFKWQFPEYVQQQDIYIGLSLSRFDGSVRPVHNSEGVPDTLCLGADVLADYTREQAQVAIAHELFHLYHFSFLFQQGSQPELATAHIPLIIEGMAVAGTEAIYPERPLEVHLHFTKEELARQQEELTTSSLRFLELMLEGAPPASYEPWFTLSDEAPPRGGYLLGYEVAKRMRMAYSFEEMVRMTTTQLREHAEEELAALATDRVLLMVSPLFSQ